MNFDRRDLRFISLFAGGFILVGSLFAYYLSTLQQTLIDKNALNTAKLYSEALRQFRTLYTSEVVAVAAAHGLAISHEYQDVNGAIPLPATMSMLLGERIGEQRTGARSYLYSAYPFPWRQKSRGLTGDFRSQAWQQLTRDPSRAFYSYSVVNDKRILRYATADVMHESCVDCHNNHPDTPKTGWQVGDVRGVLEVHIPLEEIVLQTQSSLYGIALALALISCLVFFGIVWVFLRLKRNSEFLEMRVIKRTGELEAKIQENRQTEVALVESAESYRDLYDNAPSAYASVRFQDGALLRFNKAYAKMLGYTAAELKQISVLDLYSDNKEDFREVEQLTTKLRNGESISNQVLRMRRKDGELIWISLSAKTVSDKDGNAIESQSTVVDITELKDTQDQLIQAQKLKALGTLAGGIAHDFNNAISVISGNAELALETVPEKNKNSINNILQASDKASKLVQQILTFSRMESTQLKPICLADSIRESLEMIRSVIPTSIEIRQNIIRDCPNILGDKTQIHQIIVNLCTNAHHAMENTGGLLDVSLESAGDFLVLCVSDSGSGIVLNDRQRIFDPFFTTKETGKGTGLGLSVVYNIVENHQGQIIVESEVDVGTTFTLKFPITTESIQEAPETKENSLGTSHILIVEDELAIAELYRECLGLAGYRTTTRPDGVAALTLFKEDPDQFDLVLTDHAMPKMTGESLAEQLLAIRPDLPIVLTTGYIETIDRQRKVDNGIRHYLQKPVNLALLTQTIARYL